MKKKTLVLLVGETGSGKDTVANKLPFPKIVSYSTRPMREGDIDGVNHYFITDEEMDKIEREETLIAWTKTGDIRYCAAASQLKEDVVIYIINPDGVRWFKNNYNEKDLNVITIGLFVPLKDRIKRCLLRGDDEGVLIKRILDEQLAYDHFRLDGEFDYLIRNDDSDKTALIVHYLINKEIADLKIKDGLWIYD